MNLASQNTENTCWIRFDTNPQQIFWVIPISWGHYGPVGTQFWALGKNLDPPDSILLILTFTIGEINSSQLISIKNITYNILDMFAVEIGGFGLIISLPCDGYITLHNQVNWYATYTIYTRQSPFNLTGIFKPLDLSPEPLGSISTTLTCLL